MDSVGSKQEMENRNAAKAQGKCYDLTQMKEKLLETEKPSISAFQASLLADADVAKKVANALHTKNTANFVTLIQNCSGVVLTSGIGKSGIVAERLSASLASTGTPSHYVHAAEWTHGDLGRVCNGDIVVFLSHSGNTKECVAAAELMKDRGIPVLSIVGKYDCGLRAWSDALINYEVAGPIQDSTGGAPTRSIVVQEMIVNAIECELMERRNFTKADFLHNHPGGSLGKKLMREQIQKE
ncbi:arabinose 5-phosphate isomerase KpsF-like [Xenia sp. Carnegie-2017]|uniref:arabinose 5-phosphate isomerase KpsF-like n=1 Tax=Xenia sp. Carnegie-2017 TaxID=2897299 RepID=UPI001F0417CC|nr:arabinose 5-phosphate isomerase KpsF-like [Xenia sp. Carnegie-2017]